MKGHSTINSVTAEEMKGRFVRAVQLAERVFGSSAFHNISPSDKTKFVPKFSPTVFDSMIIAIDSAIRRNVEPVVDVREKRVALLQDNGYRSAISQETMRKSNINLRINKACNYLFGIDYE